MAFQYITITQPADPLLDVLGNPVPAPPAIPAGTTYTHWFDPENATAWFQYANDALNDTAMLAALNSPVSMNIEKNVAQAQAQRNYVAQILGAIACGFNALNIPWYIDPVTRSLYRQYFSGQPTYTGPAGADAAQFEIPLNYRDNWFSIQNTWPTIGTGSDIVGPDGGSAPGEHPFGSIVAAAMNGFYQFYPMTSSAHSHPFTFFFTCSLLIAFPPGTSADLTNSVDLSNNVENDFFVRESPDSTIQEAYGVSAPLHAGQPFGSWPGNPNGQANYGTGYSAVVTNPVFPTNHAFMPDGTDLWQSLSGVLDDWRCVYFDQGQSVLGIGGDVGNSKQSIAVGLSFYLPFLQDIITGVLSRQPSQIVADARSFAMYCNASYLNATGGASAFNTAFATMPATVASQGSRYQQLFDTTAAVAAGLGAALSGATYGISAVVGAAVAACLYVIGATYNAGYSGYGSDELGRVKPFLERNCLSGDPNDPNLDSGSPVFIVPPAPAYQTGQTINIVTGVDAKSPPASFWQQLGITAPTPVASTGIGFQVAGYHGSTARFNPSLALGRSVAHGPVTAPVYLPTPAPSSNMGVIAIAGAVVVAGGLLYFASRRRK